MSVRRPVLLSSCLPVLLSSSLDQQPHRAAELCDRTAIAKEDEGGIRFSSESREPHGRSLGERGRAVEQDEREGTAAEQDVGTPGRARGIVRPDHPHAFGVAEVDPVACVERALRIDVCHPAMLFDRGFDNRAGEGGLAAARAADDLREPAAGESAAEQHGVERRDSGGKRRRDRRGSGEEPNELGEGERQESSGER